MSRQRNVVKHLVFWLSFWLIQSILFSGGHGLEFYLVKNVAIVGMQAIVAYVTFLWLFPRLLRGQYLLFATLAIVLVYLVYSFSFEVIDLALTTGFPQIVKLGDQGFAWPTNFWRIVSGSAPYSLVLLGTVVFNLVRQQRQSNEAGTQTDRTIILKEGKAIHQVNLDDVLFVQGMREYVSWHTKDKRLITLHSLSKLEEQLNDRGFLRTHKSFIVNTQRVSTIQHNAIQVPGKKIPIGRSYRAKVQDRFKAES